MKNVKFKMLVLVAALFALGTLSMAQQGNGHGPGNGPGDTPKCGQQHAWIKMLDLNEEQKAKIEALRLEHMQKVNQLKADLEIKKAELNKLETAEKANLNAIYSKIDEVYAVKISMAKERSSHRQDVRTILTPEQRIVFDTHEKRGKCHMNSGMGPHNGYPKKN